MTGSILQNQFLTSWKSLYFCFYCCWYFKALIGSITVKGTGGWIKLKWMYTMYRFLLQYIQIHSIYPMFVNVQTWNKKWCETFLNHVVAFVYSTAPVLTHLPGCPSNEQHLLIREWSHLKPHTVLWLENLCCIFVKEKKKKSPLHCL